MAMEATAEAGMPNQSNGIAIRPRSTPFDAYGKVMSFEIILDRHDGPNGIGVYSPGDLLSGHVKLELSQRLTVNNIDLLVQGTGNVAWKVRGFQGEELITDDEVYLNEIAGLVGKQSNEMVTLSAGEHVFPFACDLPWELPATFTGSHGNVSYLVKVVMQADRNEPEHPEPCIATNIFLVESRLSAEGLVDQLNSYRIDYKHPVKTSALTPGSSSVKVSMFLPRRAYDIGDNLVVNLSLTNTSKKAVKSMSLALVLEATYRVRDRTTSERLLVIDHDDEFVVRHLESRQWRHVGLRVPRCIPPSGQPHSSLMDTKYWLVFRAELERSQESIMLQTPVLIGLQLPDEMKLDEAAINGSFAEQPMDDAASGRQSRILYQGTQEPGVDYGLRSPPASALHAASSAQPALQRPLYVDVKKAEQQRPASQAAAPMPRLVQPLQPQQQERHQRASPSPSPRADADSQVIAMRFTDEQDEHSPYAQQQPQQQPVSRNPLFVPDDDDNGGGFDEGGGHENGGVHQRRLGHDGGDRALTALDASFRNGGTEEVLY